MSINSFHPLIPFQPIVAPFFRTPISLNTAPRLLIQSIATNITTILLLPSRQHRPTTDHFPTSLWLETRVQLTGNNLLGQPTERTDYSEYSFVYPMHHCSPRSCCCPSSFRTLISLQLMPFLNSTESILLLPLSPRINFYSLSVG